MNLAAGSRPNDKKMGAFPYLALWSNSNIRETARKWTCMKQPVRYPFILLGWESTAFGIKLGSVTIVLKQTKIVTLEYNFECVSTIWSVQGV